MATVRYKKLDAIVGAHPARKARVASEWERQDLEKKKAAPDAYRKGRDKALRDRYGITLAQYEKLFRKQRGKCAICKKPPKEGRPLYVDHCHGSDVVRGLLCPRCNSFVAVFDLSGDAMIERLKAYVLR